MIIIGGLVLGVILGVLQAKKLGGSRLDMAQYGTGYGIALTLVGVIITIILSRVLA